MKENFFPTLQDIYKVSKINLEDYFKSCVLLSYKTSNNQNIIDNLEFYKFNNMVAILKDIIDEENGGDKEENPGSQFNDMQNNFKSQLGNFKSPNIKMPK